MNPTKPDIYGRFVNEHGVPCAIVTGRTGEGSIPVLCLGCQHYDDGEWDDYYRITGPFCLLGVRMPRRKGTCKKRNPR